MTRAQFKHLNVGDEVVWVDPFAAEVVGKVTDRGHSGLTITWEDGKTTSIMHLDSKDEWAIKIEKRK